MTLWLCLFRLWRRNVEWGSGKLNKGFPWQVILMVHHIVTGTTEVFQAFIIGTRLTLLVVLDDIGTALQQSHA